MTRDTDASLPYHEPNVLNLLVLSLFLLLLNIINFLVDRLLFCGLLSQIFLGIAVGAPGTDWLDTHAQEFIVQLGYLGLILLVYEGGLSTSFASLKANFCLSASVALTGICLPIALSFSLQPVAGASPLQAFAAGAALCSTSLGTTFTVLSTSGLTDTRLGVVLTTAAMMDDIVGLVMVQVISSLGANSSLSEVTILRPILVSLAFFVSVPLLCYFFVKPVKLALNAWQVQHGSNSTSSVLRKPQTAFAFHTTFLLAMVISAMYAGTSNLFAAYLAGAVISWWDSELPPLAFQATNAQSSHELEVQEMDVSDTLRMSATRTKTSDPSGLSIYHAYYSQVVSYILAPFFFASIGFSIPLTLLFRGSIVWRGIIYTVLMTIGKLTCGSWLVRTSFRNTLDRPIRWLRELMRLPAITRHLRRRDQPNLYEGGRPKAKCKDQSRNDISLKHVPKQTAQSQSREEDKTAQSALQQPVSIGPSGSRKVTEVTTSRSHTTSKDPRKPVSLYPAAILGSAMVARGEIGFLISAVARSGNILTSDLFLIVTWAIFLCTLLGPVTVGLLVRRLKKLERQASRERVDVLGVWGVE